MFLFRKKINLRESAMKALETVILPDSGKNIMASGVIESLEVSPEGEALVIITTQASFAPRLDPLCKDVEAVLKKIRGIKSATVILTAEKKTGSSEKTTQDPHGMDRNPRINLPIRHVIVVASGKGGVGKSTVAFNLACTLASRGKKVGVLDADIYGPSLPRLCGLEGQKPEMEDGALLPLRAHNVSVMSIGFLVEVDRPVIWRGPMAQGAFYQMLRDVRWQDDAGNPLDILIIDMPPGTGDIQLTLAQKLRVNGAVIVSTPQDLALVDARKAIAMFEKTEVPILGIVENMSVYCCPNCGHKEAIFGHGGAREEAQRRNVRFLGEIPLKASIREKSDAGEITRDESYEAIADNILETLAE